MVVQVVVVKGEHILKNMTAFNRHMDKILGVVTDPHLKRHVIKFNVSDMKPYPPEPPQSTYVRTYDLFRAWRNEADRSRFEVISKNIIDYAPYVLDKEDQRTFHAITGWRTTVSHEQPLASTSVPVVVKSLQDELEMFLFRRGL